MDWSSIIIAVIGLLGGGGLSYLLFYKQDKQTKELSNDNIVIEQFKEVINTLNETNKENIASIKERYEESLSFTKEQLDACRESKNVYKERLTVLQDKVNELNEDIKNHLQHIDQLSTQLVQLEGMKCEVKGCKKRVPPSEMMM